MTTTGNRIKWLRQKRHWAVSRLAEVSGVSEQTIRNVESGGDCRLSTLCLLADALGVTVAELVGEDEK